MLAIALPPAPLIGPDVDRMIVYGVSAGVAVLSILLLLWGRTIIGRAILAAAGGCAGWMYGGGLAKSMNFDPFIGQIVLAVVIAALGLVLARLVWAVMAAGLFELGAVAGMIWHFVVNQPNLKWPNCQEASSFLDWVTSTYAYGLGCFQVAWDANPSTILLVTIPAALLPGMVAVLKPRASTIFTTGLLGGLALAGALWFAAVQVRPSVWPDDWMRMLIPAGVAMVLAIIGWVYQGQGELAALAEKEKKEQEAKDKAKQPPAPPLPAKKS